jgi:hypothetical protein
MLTIAHIAAAVAAATLGQMPDQVLTDASHSVMFAIDPAAIGEEPHLRCEVDPCGLDDVALHALDQALWAELAAREDLRWQAADAARREIMASHALPLAA